MRLPPLLRCLRPPLAFVASLLLPSPPLSPPPPPPPPLLGSEQRHHVVVEVREAQLAAVVADAAIVAAEFRHPCSHLRRQLSRQRRPPPRPDPAVPACRSCSSPRPRQQHACACTGSSSCCSCRSSAMMVVALPLLPLFRLCCSVCFGLSSAPLLEAFRFLCDFDDKDPCAGSRGTTHRTRTHHYRRCRRWLLSSPLSRSSGVWPSLASCASTQPRHTNLRRLSAASRASVLPLLHLLYPWCPPHPETAAAAAASSSSLFFCCSLRSLQLLQEAAVRRQHRPQCRPDATRLLDGIRQPIPAAHRSGVRNGTGVGCCGGGGGCSGQRVKSGSCRKRRRESSSSPPDWSQTVSSSAVAQRVDDDTEEEDDDGNGAGWALGWALGWLTAALAPGGDHSAAPMLKSMATVRHRSRGTSAAAGETGRAGRGATAAARSMSRRTR